MTECGKKIFLGILPKLFSIYSSAFFFAWSEIQSYFCRFSYFIPILSEKESYFDKLFRTNISLGNSNTYISMKLELYLAWQTHIGILFLHETKKMFAVFGQEAKPEGITLGLLDSIFPEGIALPFLILSCFLLQDCFVKVWSSKSFCHAANKRECHWK